MKVKIDLYLKGKRKVLEEIALICAKKIRQWSTPGAASCSHGEASCAVIRELKEIKKHCNLQIIKIDQGRVE
jgi:hypothetical protein